MSAMRLFCVLDGTPLNEAFPISIDKDACIGDLKDFVKEKLKPALDDVVAAHLAVYRLPHQVRDTVELQRAISALDLTTDTQYPWHTIGTVFLSLAPENIHVVIRVPSKFSVMNSSFPYPVWPLAPFPVICPEMLIPGLVLCTARFPSSSVQTHGPQYTLSQEFYESVGDLRLEFPQYS